MSSPTSSSPQPWADRRGLFQKGKELHEPGRRLSGSGQSPSMAEQIRRASVSSIDKNKEAAPSPPESPAKRRGSGASGALFSNLNSMKRGSEDYSERRASYSDQAKQGGFMSGWWNSTMKGQQKVSGGGAGGNTGEQQKRGVME